MIKEKRFGWRYVETHRHYLFYSSLISTTHKQIMEKKNNCSVLLGYPPFSQDFRLNLSAMIWKMASYLGCRCIWNFSGCNQGTMSWVFIWLSEFESSLGTDFSRPLVSGVRFCLWGQNQRDTWLLEKYCQTHCLEYLTGWELVRTTGLADH